MIEEDRHALDRSLDQAEEGRSVHWHRHFQYDNWKSNELGARQGLGMFIPRTAHRVVMHYLMQVPFLRCGRPFETFPTVLDAGRRFAKLQGRVFDLDELRQVLSLACVRHYIDLQPSLHYTFAVIGDGYGRLANLLLTMFPACTVVLVNLSPALQIDLASLRLGWPELHVFEPTNVEDLMPPSALRVRVVGISANKAEMLAAIPLDGAFNISSMQEMDRSVIAHYFGLLRANPSPATWFYCSNAIAKSWTDGSVIRFAEYPWDPRDEVLLDEPCPWGQKGYQTFPPRYLQRPFPIQHRLARLRKEKH